MVIHYSKASYHAETDTYPAWDYHSVIIWSTDIHAHQICCHINLCSHTEWQPDTVQSKCNVTLARTSLFAHDWIISKKRDVAIILLTSIHPYKFFSNTCKENGCHDPLFDNDSITSISTRACECDIALGLYCTYLCSGCTQVKLSAPFQNSIWTQLDWFPTWLISLSSRANLNSSNH